MRRKINRKYLKSSGNKSNARLTGQRYCPVYAVIDGGKANARANKAFPGHGAAAGQMDRLTNHAV
jgi:hypothetical protein